MKRPTVVEIALVILLAVIAANAVWLLVSPRPLPPELAPPRPSVLMP